jgi:hypothetical protein
MAIIDSHVLKGVKRSEPSKLSYYSQESAARTFLRPYTHNIIRRLHLSPELAC